MPNTVTSPYTGLPERLRPSYFGRLLRSKLLAPVRATRVASNAGRREGVPYQKRKRLRFRELRQEAS